MDVKRRDFLKTAGILGAGTFYELYSANLRNIFAQVIEGKKHVVWLQGSGDSGCTISLIQGANPDLIDVINEFRLSIDFHPTIMIPSGDEAMAVLKKSAGRKTPLDVLIVEGAVPSGNFCTVGEFKNRPIKLAELVRTLGKKAKYVVAVGTCAAYGGIPAASPNPTNSSGVMPFVPTNKLINVPGCPAHPDWIVLTLASVLSGSMPRLDAYRRPRQFFGEDIHDDCPFEDSEEDDRFASNLSSQGCLYELGCKGKRTHGDCHTRLWNNGTSWCISGRMNRGTNVYNAGAPCIGCTEPGFPDPPFSPFYSNPNGGDDDD